MTTPGPLQLMAFDQPNLLDLDLSVGDDAGLRGAAQPHLHAVSLWQLRRLSQRARVRAAASGGHVISAA